MARPEGLEPPTLGSEVLLTACSHAVILLFEWTGRDQTGSSVHNIRNLSATPEFSGPRPPSCVLHALHVAMTHGHHTNQGARQSEKILPHDFTSYFSIEKQEVKQLECLL